VTIEFLRIAAIANTLLAGVDIVRTEPDLVEPGVAGCRNALDCRPAEHGRVQEEWMCRRIHVKPT